MQNKTNLIFSFLIAFACTILGFLYYNYISSHKKVAVANTVKAIEALSESGIELGYKNLNIAKKPTFINMTANDITFIGVDKEIFAKQAALKIKNQTNNFDLSLQNIEIGSDYNIANTQITQINKNINITSQNIDIKGIVFDTLSISAQKEGSDLIIQQLILSSKNLSIIAQGQCTYNYSNDYVCQLNTSSTGITDLLNTLEKKDIFTSRGVYVATLVLKSQTSKRIITPIKFDNKGFYIKNILMTSQKNNKE